MPAPNQQLYVYERIAKTIGLDLTDQTAAQVPAAVEREVEIQRIRAKAFLEIVDYLDQNRGQEHGTQLIGIVGILRRINKETAAAHFDHAIKVVAERLRDGN